MKYSEVGGRGTGEVGGGLSDLENESCLWKSTFLV